MIKTSMMNLQFENIRLKEKLKYGADLLKDLDREINNSDLTDEKEVQKVRDYCLDIADFIRTS